MRRLATASLLAVAVVGCGGDDRLSDDEYKSELREICTASQRATDEILEDPPLRATPRSIASWFRRLRDVNARDIERVQDLEPPEDLQAAHEKALQANRQGRAEVDRIIAQLEQGREPEEVLVAARSTLDEQSRRAKDAGRELGVPECAR